MSESPDEPNGGAPPETSDQGPQEAAKKLESTRSRKARLARLRERSSAYSLHSLAKKSEVSMPAEEEAPVSGTIHLHELTKTSQVQSAPAILDALPALGVPETAPQNAPSPPPKPKSNPSLAIGAGAGAVAVAIVAVAFWGTRTPLVPAAAPTPFASTVAAPSESNIHLSASAAPEQSALAAVSTPTPSLPTRRQPARTAPPAGSSATPDPTDSPPESESTTPPDPIPTQPPKPPPPASPCGCKPNDLKCNIDCAVKGK